MSEARAYEPTVTRVKTVRVIPPTIQPLSDIPAFSARPRRVAAYARVSTSSEEQLTSYEAQVKHYTEYIKSKEASAIRAGGRARASDGGELHRGCVRAGRGGMRCAVRGVRCAHC